MSAALTSGILTLLLITQLGSPRYRDRERATMALDQMTPMALPYLKAVRNHSDTEIAIRSRKIISRYYQREADQLAKEARPSDWPKMPWMDMLPREYPDREAIVSYYISQAQQKIGRRGPPDWGDYRLATELYVRQLFLEEAEPSQVRELLDYMVNKERDWITRNGSRYNPPLTVPLSVKAR